MKGLRRIVATTRSSLLMRNIIANAVGRAWMMFMSFAFVPIYVHLLGVESYAVIGLYSTLLSVFLVLDFGLSIALNRELSRMAVLPSEQANMPDLVRTLETLYWAIGLLIGLTIVLLAPYLARHWLHANHLPVETIELSIRLIGVTIALQWPTGLYGGGIAGLQRFVWSNLIDILVSTLRGVGGVLVVAVFARSLEAYFLWQILATTVGLALMRNLLWRSLPRCTMRPRFRLAVLRRLWRFSAGMTAIAIVGMIAAQSDKVYLSSAVPLAVYAKYLIASALATATGTIGAMIVPTMLPQLSQALLTATREQILEMYHGFCQLISLAIVPVSMTVCAFAYPIILFWTRDAAIAQTAAPIASVLALAAACNGLFQLPYLLQLANGSTRVSLVANIATAIAIIPLVYLMTTWLGAGGTAMAVAVIALAQLFVAAPYIHHRFLPGANRRWLTQDVLMPSATAALLAFGSRFVIPTDLSPELGFGAAVVAGILTLAMTALCTPKARTIASRYLAERRNSARAAAAIQGDA